MAGMNSIVLESAGNLGTNSLLVTMRITLFFDSVMRVSGARAKNPFILPFHNPGAFARPENN